MSDKAWKQVERRVASFFHGKRNPLSGRNSGHGTTSDVLHPKLYIEVKHRIKHTAQTLHDATVREAKKEGKLAVSVLQQKHRKGFLVVVEGESFAELARVFREDEYQARLQEALGGAAKAVKEQNSQRSEKYKMIASESSRLVRAFQANDAEGSRLARSPGKKHKPTLRLPRHDGANKSRESGSDRP